MNARMDSLSKVVVVPDGSTPYQVFATSNLLTTPGIKDKILNALAKSDSSLLLSSASLDKASFTLLTSSDCKQTHLNQSLIRAADLGIGKGDIAASRYNAIVAMIKSGYGIQPSATSLPVNAFNFRVYCDRLPSSNGLAKPYVGIPSNLIVSSILLLVIVVAIFIYSLPNGISGMFFVFKKAHIRTKLLFNSFR